MPIFTVIQTVRFFILLYSSVVCWNSFLKVDFLVFCCGWHSLRMTLVVLLQMTSFLLIAFAKSQFQAILGVICTSMALGLGEVTLLSTSADYNK